MSQINLVANIYNPANLSERELIENFVVRKKEFNRVFSAIKNSTMQYPEQHFIIQGQRGSGKTTLLLRLYYEIKNDVELSKWLIPIRFGEEQYNIRSLYVLWEEIALALEEIEDFGEPYEQMLKYREYDDYEEKCYGVLKSCLNQNGKKIVLFIDNFGDMLKKFQEREHQRLREVLITSPDIRIIGFSSVVLESTYDYSKPFFQFFDIIQLQGLNQADTNNLLLKLSEKYKQAEVENIVKNESGRVEALRRLTGGVPRTMVLLFEIFADDKDGNSFKDLEMILDRVTPLYKHRMDDLSTQQQAIVHEIAIHWDAMGTKEVAQKTRMDSKAVSAQLNLLEKNRIIEKIATDTKNHLYQISERFFNIWYLMRYGRKGDRNRVQWLVQFLEVWCDRGELEQRTRRHIEALRDGRLYERHALYMTEALARTGISDKLQDELIKSTRECLRDSELVKELSKSDLELLEEASEYYDKKEYRLALKKLEEINNKDENIYYNMALLYENEYKEYEKAEKYYSMAVEKGNTSAMNNLALLYIDVYKEYEKAEKYYLMAVEKEDIDAMYNLANLYRAEYKEYKKAEKYYLMAVEKDDTSAMYNLALLYKDVYKEYEKAEKYYSMAVEKEHIDAMYNLANLYTNEYKEYEKAEKYYLMAVEKGVTYAMCNLATLYEDVYKEYEKAEKYYLMAAEKGNTDAMNNLANLYSDVYKEYEKAEKYYVMAVEKGHIGAMNNLANLYSDVYKEYEKAEKYYVMAVEKGHTITMYNLAWLYFALRKDKLKALEYTRMAFEIEKNIRGAYVLTIIALWNNEISEGLKVSEIFMSTENICEELEDGLLQLFLLLLISKKQYNYTLKLFKQNKHNLIDRYKPIYYALMYFMQDEYPNEYKKMGEELKQTVEEIIQEIKQMEIDYA